jgi:hypothetical protein
LRLREIEKLDHQIRDRVYMDSYRDGKIGYNQDVIRPNGQKHIFINHIAFSTNHHNFKNKIFGI